MGLHEIQKELDDEINFLDLHLTHRECDYVVAFDQLRGVREKFLEYLEANENPDLKEIVDYALLIDGMSRPFGNQEKWIKIQIADSKLADKVNRECYQHHRAQGGGFVRIHK